MIAARDRRTMRLTMTPTTQMKHPYHQQPDGWHAAYSAAYEAAQPDAGGAVIPVHLELRESEWEFQPATASRAWTLNGSVPGPTLEARVGDVLEIHLTNRMAQPTVLHWHGLRVPAAVVHPRDVKFNPVDRDFAFVMAAYEIEPGAATPKVAEMLEFNLWTWNSRVFPGIDPLVARRNDRVRVRIANLTMTNHPIHIHGHNFTVALTDGGWVPKSARWPETTADVPVGAIRALEFVADNQGDWAFHCHKSHHVMNAMGHNVPTMIGVDHRGVAERISRLIPARERTADDDRQRSLRRHGDGRHVHRGEGARRPRAQRLQGSRLVPASPGHRGLRMEGRGASGDARRAGRDFAQCA
jgi:FtsP/CotA-like multicopper oxidase with cupredoxin domain